MQQQEMIPGCAGAESDQVATEPDPELPSRGAHKTDCVVCYGSYDLSARLPRRLHCGHTFCQACLRRLNVLANAQWWIPCPQCRQNTPTPRGGVTMLDLDLVAFLAVKSEKELPRALGQTESSKTPAGEKPVTRQPSMGACREVLPEPDVNSQNDCCGPCFCCGTTAAFQG